MESKYEQSRVKKQESSKLKNSNSKLKKLRSHYFIQKFFDYIPEKITLSAIKYNKYIQKLVKSKK